MKSEIKNTNATLPKWYDKKLRLQNGHGGVQWPQSMKAFSFLNFDDDDSFKGREGGGGS